MSGLNRWFASCARPAARTRSILTQTFFHGNSEDAGHLRYCGPVGTITVTKIVINARTGEPRCVCKVFDAQIHSFQLWHQPFFDAVEILSTSRNVHCVCSLKNPCWCKSVQTYQTSSVDTSQRIRGPKKRDLSLATQALHYACLVIYHA